MTTAEQIAAQKAQDPHMNLALRIYREVGAKKVEREGGTLKVYLFKDGSELHVQAATNKIVQVVN